MNSYLRGIKPKVMILTVDIGNTRIKAAVFEDDKAVAHFIFSNEELRQGVEKILNQHQDVSHLVVASVGKLSKEAFFGFEGRVCVRFISYSDKFPFTNLYETPSTLGIDRMVLASGAALAFPNQNRLVIDAGTCITYDFVDEQDNYLGGAISPGMRLRYEALHNYTAKLPLLSLENPEGFIGNSTNKAIHSGVVNGVVNEIDGFIDRYSAQYPKFTIILTGGDADFLAKRLKNTIFANSNFLLESLNQTFHFFLQ
jgi:type III pantothenate kinase